MAKREFDIPGIIQTIWGYRGLPFPAGNLLNIPDQDDFSQLGAALTAQSSWGVPYFMPVELVPEPDVSIMLPNPVISIQGSKRIVETPLTGQVGILKELISINDYEITIRCVATEPDNKFPEGSIIELRDLYEKNKAIGISCALTDIWLKENDNIVIMDIVLPDMQVYEGVQAYEIREKSDRAFELEIE